MCYKFSVFGNNSPLFQRKEKLLLLLFFATFWLVFFNSLDSFYRHMLLPINAKSLLRWWLMNLQQKIEKRKRQKDQKKNQHLIRTDILGFLVAKFQRIII